MASAAPTPTRPISVRALLALRAALNSAGPVFLGAVLAALFTYAVTAKLNRDASLQQQYLAAVQEFTSTGARVDATVTTLADATYDGVSVSEAKKESREAIASHAAATLGLIPVVGRGNVFAYMQGVADMRVLIDQSGDVPAAIRASRGRMALIENRLVIISEARQQIYS